MARPKTTTTPAEKIPTPDDIANQMIDELPPAFDEDGRHTTSNSDSLTTAQITGASFNRSQRAEDHKLMSAPDGDYIKTERWLESFKRTSYDDREPGDVYPDGRSVYTISGKPEPRVVNGVTYQPTLFVRCSPDRRMHRDRPGEFDFNYKMYDRICEVFLTVMGRELENETDLQQFLEEGQYTINTLVGRDGRLQTMNIKETLSTPQPNRYERGRR
jgi:hypothetical protein